MMDMTFLLLAIPVILVAVILARMNPDEETKRKRAAKSE